MAFKLVFNKAVLDDLQEGMQWYDKQQKGLGARLASDINDVVRSVKLNPFFASVKFSTIRSVSCKSFPYALHYEVDEVNGIIRILSIFHFSRQPYWL